MHANRLGRIASVTHNRVARGYMKKKLITCLSMALILAILVPALGAPRPAMAAPIKEQIYYLSIPEDDALQMFRDDGGTGAVSPVRSVTSIAIGTTGTLVYYDHWENGFAANITHRRGAHLGR